jgi:gentisate 1,2-dioxygenase
MGRLENVITNPPTPPAQPAADTRERQAFYEKISRQNLTRLWLSLADLVTFQPHSPCYPAVVLSEG